MSLCPHRSAAAGGAGRRFRLAHSLALLLVSWMAGGCDRQGGPTVADPSALITAADHGSGVVNPYFHFLPPLARQPQALGESDASLLPHAAVEVCRLGAAGCEQLVARFTAAGSGSERLRLSEDDGGTGPVYHTVWNTRASGARAGERYRIRLLVAGTELGRLEVRTIAPGGGGQHQGGDDAGVEMVAGRAVPIRFHIARGAVFVVDGGGGTIHSLDGAVRLYVPEGALPGPVGITMLPAIDPPADPTLVPGTAFEFGPDGLVFAHPAQLTMGYDPQSLPAGANEALLLIHRSAGDHWAEVDPRPDGGNVDPSARTVTGTIHGFSSYAILQQRPVASVTVTPNAATVNVNETVQLAAALADAHGNPLVQRIGRTVVWSSSDEAVAGVDPAGLVTGVSGGSATVTAASNGQSGSAAITVEGGGDVILRLLSLTLVQYDPASFGRRIRVAMAYRTGETLLDERERATVRCSEVDPDNVALVLELPGGLSFVADGRGAWDPAARTVTWQLGRLDGDDPANCERAPRIQAMVDVAPSLPDGGSVRMAARIHSTTPGDDPADNVRELAVQVGFLPVEVWVRNLHTPNCDGSWTLHRPVACERVTPGTVSAIASWSTSALPWQGETIPRKVADLQPGGGYVFEVVTSAQAKSGYGCTISSCTSLGAGTPVAGNNTLLQLYNPNPYPVHFTVREELSAFASCNPPETSGPSAASVSFTWHNFDAPALRCGWTGWYTPSQSWSQRREMDSRSGTCEIQRSDRTGTQRCFATPLHGGFDLNSGSPRVSASAGTELVMGSGGTLESFQLGESHASAQARWEVRIVR